MTTDELIARLLELSEEERQLPIEIKTHDNWFDVADIIVAFAGDKVIIRIVEVCE